MQCLNGLVRRRLSLVRLRPEGGSTYSERQLDGFASTLPSALFTIRKIPREPYLPFLERSVMHQMRLQCCISCA